MTTMVRVWLLISLVFSFFVSPHLTHAQGSDPATAKLAETSLEVTNADFEADEAAPLAVPEDEGHPYHGSGTMTIKNLTDAEIAIYYAFGTVLQAEDDSEQDLVTYSTELEKQPLMPQTGIAPITATTAPIMMVVGLGLMLISLAGYGVWQTRR